jgi:predicted O-methyltransferase YrrM
MGLESTKQKSERNTIIDQVISSESYQNAFDFFSREPYWQNPLISWQGLALLDALVRQTRPSVVVEIGTFHGRTAHAIARVLEANGHGEIHTVGPFDSHAFLPLFDEWPPDLKKRTRFYPMSSMDFFMEAERLRMRFDLVLVDGNHDYEFALFDIQCAARRMNPRGFIIIDNVSQAGPYYAAVDFLAQWPSWINCGEGSTQTPSFALFAWLKKLFARNPDLPRAFDRQRANIPGTDFFVLQAPSFFPVRRRPLTFGEVPWDFPKLNGIKFDIVPTETEGIIYVEAVLRGFTNGPQSETATAAEAVISPSQRGVTVQFEKPLETISCESYTVEPWLAWSGDSPIGLTNLPLPF